MRYVYLCDSDAGVIRLLLNERQRDSGFGHIRDPCILQTVELKIHRELTAWTDYVVPESRDLAAAHLLRAGSECMRI